MKVRYQDELSVEFDIDEKLYEYNTIKLILQPLIENAIYMALSQRTSQETFLLQRLLSSIIGLVTDDGVGMDSELLTTLRKTNYSSAR